MLISIIRPAVSRVAACCLLVLAISFVVGAQTTAFTFQGRLSDSSTTSSGTYDMQFALFDTVNGVGQIGSTQTVVGVPVVNGVYTVQLDFGASPFAGGADRYLEMRVKRPADAAYMTLNPRQKLTSTPYAIRSLSTGSADNALNLNGQPAVNFVTTTDPRLSDTRQPAAGSGFYIQNGTAPQTADFNIAGGGTTGGRTTAAGLSVTAPANGKALDIASGRIVLSYATVAGGTTSADAGTMSSTAAVIEISDNGAAGAGATANLPASAENGAIIVVGTSDPDGGVVFGVSGGASYAFNPNQSARFTRIAGAWKFLGQ